MCEVGCSRTRCFLLCTKIYGKNFIFKGENQEISCEGLGGNGGDEGELETVCAGEDELGDVREGANGVDDM